MAGFDPESIRNRVRAQVAQQDPELLEPRDAEGFSPESIRNRVAQQFMQQGVPDVGERDGIGEITARQPTFEEAYRSGTDQVRSSYDYVGALLHDLLGNEELRDELLDRAMTRDRVSQGMMAGRTTFQQLVEDPSLGGGLAYAKETLGQLTPMILENVAGALAGSVIGGPAGTVTGATGSWSNASRILLQNSVKQQIMREARDTTTDAARNQVLSTALRAQAAQRGAYLGSAAVELRQGAGEAYRETAEAGDPSPWLALGTAAPFAAIGFLPDKLVIDSLATAVRNSDPATRSALREMLTQVAAQTAGQSAAELGQEELLIRLHDYLTETDYAGSDEAFWRRMEAGAAGAVGGTAIGGVSGTTTAAIHSAMQGRLPFELTPEQRQFGQRLESVLATPPVTSREAIATRDMLGEGEIIPESQRDIDAQFAAMLGEESAKQAMEITEGSPMPSGYSEGMEGVYRVDTPEGILLTVDENLAQDVSLREGSPEAVARALGYAQVKDEGMTQAVVARNDAGDVVHSELISPNETPEAALTRARQFAPNVELVDATSVLSERSTRVRDEGRNPEMEVLNNRMRKLEGIMQRLQESLDILEQARRMPEFSDRLNEIHHKTVENRNELQRIQRQAAEVEQRRIDALRRQERSQELRAMTQRNDARVQGMIDRATSDSANVTGGIEVTDTATGEVLTISREAYEDAVTEFRTENEGENLNMSDAEVARRLADEFEQRGYLLEATDVEPIRVQNVTRDEARGATIPEGSLDPSQPRAHREPHRNLNAREQVLARQHRLGPMTEATIVDGVRTPVSAVRQLRKFRQMYPEDSWSLISWTNDRGQRVYQVKRERTYSERAADDPVVRDVEGTDSVAIQQTRERSLNPEIPNPTVTPDPAITTTARQRVLGVTEQARWGHEQRVPPNNYSLRMVDPDGREGFYDPTQVAVGGFDSIQGMVANRAIQTAEHRQMALMAALGILQEAGYVIDANTIPNHLTASTRMGPVTPQSYAARVARARRHRSPEWARYSRDWDALDAADRFEFFTENGLENIGGVDISNMMENQLQDIDITQLPAGLWPEISAWKYERYGNEQPEHFQRQPITNRDLQPQTLSRMGADVLMDPAIPAPLRLIFTQAKQEAGLTGPVRVITGVTTRQMIRSFPAEVRAEINTNPSLASLLNNRPPPNLRGRTVFLSDGSAVIWVNHTMQPEILSVTLAHELGHVAFRQHQEALLSDPQRAQRLQHDFEMARNEGNVKQYNDSQLAFEEWFADRFSAWVHNRQLVDSEGVARNGRFRQLYRSLRTIATRLRVTASKLQAAGQTALFARIQPNQAVDSFLDGIARVHAKEQSLNRMRQRYVQRALNRINRAADNFQPPPSDMESVLNEMGYLAELEAEMRQVQAELDAETQGGDIRPSLVKQLPENDPVANVQKERIEDRTAAGIARRVEFDVGAADLHHGRRDPNPRIDYTDQLEPQPTRDDPAPAQTFESTPAEGPTPEAGGGGAGQGTPPPGGTPPPAGGESGPLGGGMNPIWEAVNGRANRWASTETFRNVLAWVNENLGPVMQHGLKALRNLSYTADGRLRRLGPHGRRIANWFYDDTFDRNTSGDRGYLNAVEIELSRRMAEVEALLPDDPRRAEAALREAQGGRPTNQLSRDGKRIRRYLRRFYTEYLAENTHGIRMRNDYFPRVYDMSEVMARSDQFLNVLMASGYTSTEATRILHAMMEGESTVEFSTDDQLGSGPGMSARLERRLSQLDDTVLQQHGFLIEPRAALMQYLRSAVKRAEYEKRFSGEVPLSQVYADMVRRRNEGRWVDQDYYDYVQGQMQRYRNPDQVMVYDPSARLKAELAKMDPEQRSEAEELIQGYMGRNNTLFGRQISPAIASTISTVGGLMYMATLGLSAISQITDFGAIVMRTRGVEGIGMMHRAIMQVPADERLALARAVGSISKQANLDALRMTYGNDFMTPTMRKVTDTFFKVIGLEQITNFSRSVATNMGSEFIQVHAMKAAAGDQRSQRYLSELRLTPQQVFDWQNNGRRFDGESGAAVREALFQFTDESILRPNAAMRPGWASNPWFTLMWQLKSFAFGFYKVVMRGMANEIRQRNREGASTGAQLAPLLLTGAVMLPLAYSTMVIRDVAKEGLNSAFDDDEYHWNSTRNRSSAEWLLELTDRSGLLGPWALVNSAFDAYGWGENPLLTLAGPAAEKAGHLAKGEFGRVANDMIPVAGLVR